MSSIAGIEVLAMIAPAIVSCAIAVKNWSVGIVARLISSSEVLGISARAAAANARQM